MKLFLSSPSLLREAIGLGAGAGELPALYDQIFAPDRRSFKPAFENLSRSLRHSGLALKAMIPTYAASCRCEPWFAMDDQAVGLRKPNISRLAGEVAFLQVSNARITIANLRAHRVYQIRSALHAL
jgi:hypothetical protein